jgi:hypothetical protein
MTLMDTAQVLGNLGDFLGAIVVTATLIYLAVQVRQNTKALHAQSRQAVLAGSQVALISAIDHPDIHLAILRGRNTLSPEENVKVFFWLTTVMRAAEFAWLQFRDGVIDEVQWRQELLVVQTVLGDDINRLWWSRARPMFAAEFAAYVDEVVRDAPVTNAGRGLTSWCWGEQHVGDSLGRGSGATGAGR